MSALEPDRVRDLDGLRPDADLDSESGEGLHDEAMEVGHRSRLERDPGRPTVGGAENELVVDEVEDDRQGAVPVSERRRREASRGHLERDVPVVIDERGQREADLAHDLRPHVERREGVLPGFEGQRGPGFAGRRRHGHASSPIMLRFPLAP